MIRSVCSIVRRRAAIVAAMLSAALVAPLRGQTWGLVEGATSVALPTSAFTFLDCSGGPIPPCCEDLIGCSLANPAALADVPGWDRWWYSISLCKSSVGGVGTCGFMKAYGVANVRLRGLGSAGVLIRWDAIARAKERCENAPGVYYGNGAASIAAGISLAVVGGTPGTPVTIFYRWRQASTNNFSPEAGGDDTPQIVSGGTLTLEGAPLFGPPDFDLVNVKGGRWGPNRFGSIAAVVGSVIDVATAVDLESTVTPPAVLLTPVGIGHQQCFREYDSELVSWEGEIELFINSPVPPPPDSGEPAPGVPEPQPDLLFTVDIGGDAELADPTAEGNEVFDPGDIYPWTGPPLPPGGANGVINDGPPMFGFDPAPTPLVPPPLLTCSAFFFAPPPPRPLPIAPFFNLDDFDLIDFSLIGMVSPTSPLPAPIARFESGLVHTLARAVVSYEDNIPWHFTTTFPTACAVPSGSASPLGATHGRVVESDEVQQVNFPLDASPPYTTPALAAGLAETAVHISLGPDPPPFPDETLDDDVNGIDVIPAGGIPAAGAFVVFTVDHKARGPLLPLFPADNGGLVFQRPIDGGPPVAVISPSVHLGLPPTTDLRALEFVWLPDPAGTPGQVLALVFSVARDNPDTVADESGGLDPQMLYYSFLTGTSTGFITGSNAPLLVFPLDDDIDAFTNYRRPLRADMVGVCCPGNADKVSPGTVNFADITAVLVNFGADASPSGSSPGDADCNGVINFADITAVLVNFLNACP